MTHDELNALSDNDINRLIAERVMGWKTWTPRGVEDAMHIWKKPCSDPNIEDADLVGKWYPSTDHNDCAAMRAEIERRGLQMLFVLFMQRVFDASGNLESNWWVKPWFILNSKPRQQCIAALLTMEEKS